ncbi:hypothetical protein BXU08_19100 [Sphingomonas sp. LM7]|nr:hypothetical protein BXU08_19100 [Sphingomonas sp. LM7]
MIVAGLFYLGMFALAAGMSRHAPALLGGWHRPTIAARLPRAGWILVVLSLALTLLSADWSRALVAWLGLAPLVAGIVVLSLTFAPVLARTGVVLAAGLAVVGLGMTLAGASAAL